jgi:hypothetical protein
MFYTSYPVLPQHFASSGCRWIWLLVEDELQVRRPSSTGRPARNAAGEKQMGRQKLLIIKTIILQNVTKNVSLGRILWHLISNGKRHNEKGTLLPGEQLDLRDITHGKRKHTRFHSHEFLNFHPSTNVTWVTRSWKLARVE